MPARRPQDELLADLVRLFLAEGFADITIAELAERLHCSRSTLYGLAASKDDLILLGVRSFFRDATERVESRLEATASAPPALRLRTYLVSIAEELAAASPRFFKDLDRVPAAGAIYRQNTMWAAERVRRLVGEVDSTSDPRFIAAVAGLVMEAIHRGEFEREAGLSDAGAYLALATLLGGAPPSASGS